MYDIIGDIHGYASKLEALLKKMGYEKESGVYRHPERKAIFVGDLIDRGPEIKEVLQIVRPMVELEAALIVMGNHEFNAIAYHTEDPERPNEYLRPHIDEKTKQHSETLKQMEGEYDSMLAFFYAMPLWLELPDIRVVHACWDPPSLSYLQGLVPDKFLTEEFLIKASKEGSQEYEAVEKVLKGKEAPLGEFTFYDKDKSARNKARIRWYQPYTGQSITEYTFQAGVEFPETPFDPALDEPGYSPNEKPVFFGHYWLRGEQPKLCAPNVCCLDYSVARDGILCAYRYIEGENVLNEKNFVWV